MEIKDFRKYILDSPIKDKLRNLNVVLKYSYSETEITINGLESIYKFIYSQVVGWNQIENIPNYLNHSKTHFEKLKAQIISLTDYFNESNIQFFDNKWQTFLNILSKSTTDLNNIVFLYDSSETTFLINTSKKTNGNIDGAIAYLTNKNININNNTDYLTSLLFAYEYKHQSDSEILNRRNHEKISLGQIKEKYNQYIIEAEQQLNSNLSDAKENLVNHFETIDKLKEEKENNFENWFKNTEEEFDNFYSLAQENIKINEDLYKEKLRLEAPAKYWKDRAINLKKEGKNYLNWLIGISVCAGILLFILLMLLGNSYFETVFNDRIKGIKWSLILITIVSLLAFVIKILSKMTFSSFHLSRDSEEREQLTHFYLALKKDTTIEPEERQLILQSLFSRADTGLLKEDSSPTMPTTSIVEKFTGK